MLTAEEAAIRDTRLRQRMTEVLDILNGSTSMLREEMFTPGLLEEMSFADITVQFELLYKSSGGFSFFGTSRIDDSTMRAWVRPAGGEAVNEDLDLIVKIEQVPPYAIDDIILQPAQKVDVSALGTWDEVDEALSAMPAEASLGAWEVMPDGEMKTIHRLNADARRSVGTASALYIVSAIVDAVNRKQLTWDTPILIRSDLKSLPRTNLSDLPSGFEVTVEDTARFMNRDADTTAFDHLVELLGRETLTGAAGASLGENTEDVTKLDPFLRTMDLFRLKCGLVTDPAKEYAEAEATARWGLLDTLVPECKVFSEFFHSWTTPVQAEEIGWFSSADALGKTMGALWHASSQPGMEPLSSVMQIADRFPVDRRTWNPVWFTIGSEPGSIAGIWALHRQDGRTFILTTIFNNPKKDVHDALGSDAVFAARELLKKHK